MENRLLLIYPNSIPCLLYKIQWVGRVVDVNIYDQFSLLFPFINDLLEDHNFSQIYTLLNNPRSFPAQARIDFKQPSDCFPTAGMSFIIKIA